MQMNVATMKVVYEGNILCRKNNERLFQGIMHHFVYKWEKGKIFLVSRQSRINLQGKMSSIQIL